MILLSFSAAKGGRTLACTHASEPARTSRFIAIGLGVFILKVAYAQAGAAQQASLPARSNDLLALPEITVSAAETPLPTDKIGSSVTVITVAEIETEQRRTFPDLLQKVPGLNVVQAGGPGGQTSVFIRGTNSNHVKVLIDGIDVSDPSNPNRSFDFGQLTNADIARVEVLRGPQSGLYGADAIGGVIAITTKKGNGPPKITGTIEGGSFGAFNQTVQLSGSSNQFNYAFVISHLRSSDTPVTPRELLPIGWRALNNFYDNTTVSTNLGAVLSDTLTVNVVARGTASDLKFTGTDFSTFPAFPAAARSEQVDRQFYTRGEVLWDVFDGGLKNQFGLAYGLVDTKAKSPATAFGPVDPTANTGERVKFNYLGEIDLSRSGVSALAGQTLFIGADAEEERLTNQPNSYRNGNRAGFVQLVSRFTEVLTLTSNVRYDDNDRFGDAVTYRFAPALTVPATGTVFKASYGTGFKSPTLNQLFVSFPAFNFFANPHLRPEESRGFDFGFEQPLFSDRVRFGATYYQNDISNLITTSFGLLFSTSVNVGKAKTNGAEAFVSWQVFDRFKVRGDYTYTLADDETRDLSLLRRPKHKGSVQAIWTPIEKLSIVATFIGISSFTDGNRDFSVQRLKAPGYGIVNLAANYEINPDVSAFARIENVLDRRYQDPTGFLRPGLGAYGGLRATY